MLCSSHTMQQKVCPCQVKCQRSSRSLPASPVHSCRLSHSQSELSSVLPSHTPGANLACVGPLLPPRGLLPEWRFPITTHIATGLFTLSLLQPPLPPSLSTLARDEHVCRAWHHQQLTALHKQPTLASLTWVWFCSHLPPEPFTVILHFLFC